MTQIARATTTLFIAGLLTALGVGQTLASPCADEIASLETKVKDQSTGSISAGTAGQAAAGAREGQGVTAESGNASTQAAPAQKSAEAGKGGDAAMQASVALDEARTADGKGDAKACSEAVARAKGQLAGAP